MIILIDLSQYFLNAAHYWQLPSLSGSRLLSYGGTLEWTYSYSTRYSSPVNDDDVILSSSSDNSAIYFRFGNTGPAERDNKRTLTLK